jgi:sulfide:quinone oxidoreductase
MDVRKLSDDVFVAPQLTVADVAEAARRGFRTIISNRPDHEAPGQPTAQAIAAAAEAHGLAFRFVPVVSGRMTMQDVDDFAAALAEVERPVIAYCRSGTRSATLWSLAMAGRMDTNAIIAAAAEAGYDLEPMRRLIEARKR